MLSDQNVGPHTNLVDREQHCWLYSVLAYRQICFRSELLWPRITDPMKRVCSKCHTLKSEGQECPECVEITPSVACLDGDEPIPSGLHFATACAFFFTDRSAPARMFKESWRCSKKGNYFESIRDESDYWDDERAIKYRTQGTRWSCEGCTEWQLPIHNDGFIPVKLERPVLSSRQVTRILQGSWEIQLKPLIDKDPKQPDFPNWTQIITFCGEVRRRKHAVLAVSQRTESLCEMLDGLHNETLQKIAYNASICAVISATSNFAIPTPPCAGSSSPFISPTRSG